MTQKTRKVVSNILAGMVGFGLGITVVSLLFGVITNRVADETTHRFTSETVSISLFANDWGDYDLNPLFLILSYFATIAGIVLMTVSATLRSRGKKFIKPMHIVGVALSGVGGILILITAILLKNDYAEVIETMFRNMGMSAGQAAATVEEANIRIGFGVVAAFIGGIVACIGGGLLLIKAFDPIITAKNQPALQPVQQPDATVAEQPVAPEQTEQPIAPEQTEQPIAEQTEQPIAEQTEQPAETTDTISGSDETNL